MEVLTALEVGDGIVLSSNKSLTIIEVNGIYLKSWTSSRGMRLQAEVLPVNMVVEQHQATNFP